MKVQNQSEGCFERLTIFNDKMGKAYEELAEEEDKIVGELDMLDSKVEAIISGEAEGGHQESEKTELNK